MLSLNFTSPLFSAPFIRNQSSNNAGKLQPNPQLLFCLHFSHAFCRMKTLLSILLLSSQAYKHSNHHTYGTPCQQICTCLSHLYIVCKPGSKRIIFSWCGNLSQHSHLLFQWPLCSCLRALLSLPAPATYLSWSFIPSTVCALLTAISFSSFPPFWRKCTLTTCPRAAGWGRAVSLHTWWCLRPQDMWSSESIPCQSKAPVCIRQPAFPLATGK